DPAVERLDLPDRLGQVLRTRRVVGDRLHLRGGVDGDDVRALLRQTHRVAAALPARSPGAERDLALRRAHVRCFPRARRAAVPWGTGCPLSPQCVMCVSGIENMASCDKMPGCADGRPAPIPTR